MGRLESNKLESSKPEGSKPESLEHPGNLGNPEAASAPHHLQGTFRLEVLGGNPQHVGPEEDAGDAERERERAVVEQRAGGASLHFKTPKARLIDAAQLSIRADLAAYPKALAAFEALQSDPEALAHWDMANYITMRKLGYNDHGRVHAFITGAAAMTITHLLLDAGVQPDLIASGIGDEDDVLLTVILGTMLHDIGNQVHRVDHEMHGTALALPILDRIMTPLYPDPFKRVKVRSFILGAINCHDLNPPPLTVEGGITAVADGTDITKGRGRKAFRMGSVDIHSISALAVDQVVIEPGQERPVRIRVTMNNSGGIFQVEEVLAPKVINTPLRDYIELHAATRPEGEEQILRRVRLEGTQFVVALEDGEQVAARLTPAAAEIPPEKLEELAPGGE